MKNRKLFKISVCAIALFLDPRVCLAQQAPVVDESNRHHETKTLRASLQIDDRAQPLNPLLLPGNLFDKELATSILRIPGKSQQQWYKVPSWQAGSWKSEEGTGTRYQVYENGKPVEKEPWGHGKVVSEFDRGQLKDKNGDIWDVYSSGWVEVDYGDQLGYGYIVFQSAGNQHYPNLYSERVQFLVDPETRRIKEVYRATSRNIVKFIAPGIIKTDTLQTKFKDSGLLESKDWSEIISHRTESFSSYEHKLRDQEKMKASFRAYCKAEGLGDLLPAK